MAKEQDRLKISVSWDEAAARLVQKKVAPIPARTTKKRAKKVSKKKS